MMLKVKWFIRGSTQPIEVMVPSDCVEITIPPQPDEKLPGLVVNVNTDAVVIHRDDGKLADMFLHIDSVNQMDEPALPAPHSS